MRLDLSAKYITTNYYGEWTQPFQTFVRFSIREQDGHHWLDALVYTWNGIQQWSYESVEDLRAQLDPAVGFRSPRLWQRKGVMHDHVILREEDMPQFNVWLDGMLESGSFQGFSNVPEQLVVWAEVRLEDGWSDPWTTPPQHTTDVTFSILKEKHYNFIIVRFTSRKGNNQGWAYMSADDLRANLEGNKLKRGSMETPRRLHFSDDALAQLNVWLDSMQERGLAGLAGLSGKTEKMPYFDYTGEQPRRKDYRFKVVKELGCGLYIGQPPKRSRLPGPYQLVMRGPGTRLAAGDDIDLLTDLGIMFTSIPGVCEAIQWFASYPVMEPDDKDRAQDQWVEFWTTMVPKEARDAFQKHLNALVDAKLITR